MISLGIFFSLVKQKINVNKQYLDASIAATVDTEVENKNRQRLTRFRFLIHLLILKNKTVKHGRLGQRL